MPKKKEYVIPLIRKVVWRGVGEGEGAKMEGKNERDTKTDHVKADEELALDKEAAEAIISGIFLIGIYQHGPWKFHET